MSQNFRVAAWVPEGALNPREIIITQAAALPGQPVNTDMGAPAAATGGNKIQGADLTVSATAPTTPNNGDTWVDISTAGNPLIKVYDAGSTNWVVVADLPQPTQEGQVIISGQAPGYAWGASNIDGTRY